MPSTKNAHRPKGKKSIVNSAKPKGSRSGWKVAVKVLLLLVWVAAAVIVSQLAVGYLMLWMLGPETFAQPVSTAIYSALSYVLALAWLVFATPRIVVKTKIVNHHKDGKHYINGKLAPKAISRAEIGLNGLPTWTDIGLAPIGFVVSTLLAAGLVAIFSSFPWFDATQAQNVGFGLYLSGWERALAFITLVVIAPIAEELVFRGWLYGKLRLILSEKVPEVVAVAVSILLVSILFGAVHMQWNVGVNVFALSVVLCGMREITGAIYAGILTHMLKNGVAFFLLYIVGIG